MPRELIATDLDGTILPDIHTLSPRSAKALRKAAQQVHVAVFATARPLCMTEWVYDAVGPDTPVVLLGGALTVHPGHPELPPREMLPHRQDAQAP